MSMHRNIKLTVYLQLDSLNPHPIFNKIIEDKPIFEDALCLVEVGEEHPQIPILLPNFAQIGSNQVDYTIEETGFLDLSKINADECIDNFLNQYNGIYNEVQKAFGERNVKLKFGIVSYCM